MAQKKEEAYYRLHTDAIEDLATANEENTPKYSREELEKYTSAGKKHRVPVSLKVFLIKAWFYGAVCYFAFWGLGIYVPSQLDLCVIAAVLMGLTTDLLINSLIRFGERHHGDGLRYMMVGRTGAGGLLLNLIYAFGLMFLIVTAYGAVNALLAGMTGGRLFWGVGPIGYGLLAAGLDTLLIACKHMLADMAADARCR